jgi:hypothetical protein
VESKQEKEGKERMKTDEYVIGIWTWKRIAILEALTLTAIAIVVIIDGLSRGILKL